MREAFFLCASQSSRRACRQRLSEEHGSVTTTFGGRSQLIIWIPGNPGTIAFVEVTIGGPDNRQARRLDTDRGGLWLMTVGMEAVGLASTTVILPEQISLDPVASLNHAYTRLSEKLETSRISHTGNICTRVLYRERSGTWYPLDILRNKALEKREAEIARELWENFMASVSSARAPGKGAAS
jgi:hypothetical protein